MKSKSIRVIFDTNVWISFLIGKRLSYIKAFVVDRRITIIITEQLLTEIKVVTSREKLQKYFPKNSVIEFNIPLHFLILNFFSIYSPIC